jgi:uncharacterized membrane protein YgcG
MAIPPQYQPSTCGIPRHGLGCQCTLQRRRVDPTTNISSLEEIINERVDKRLLELIVKGVVGSSPGSARGSARGGGSSGGYGSAMR